MNRNSDWHLNAHEVARRIEISDLPGFLKKNLEVEQGTKALLLVDGRHDATLDPGSYPFTKLSERISGLQKAKSATAVIVATRDIQAGFAMDRIFTSDPLMIDFEFHVTLAVESLLLFFQNVIKESQSFLTGHLCNHLKDELSEVVKAFIAGFSIEQLHNDLGIKSRLENEISIYLNRTLSRDGLRLIALQTLNYRHQEWDKVTQTKADYFLQISQQEAELEGKKRLFDVFNRSEIQALAQDTARVEFFEQRASLWERLRKAVLEDKKSEISTSSQLEDMIREVDKDRLLKDHEIEELKKDIDFDRQDKVSARDQLSRKLEIERRYELKRAELAGQHSLDEAQLTFELNQARTRADWEFEQGLRAHKVKLEKDRKEAELELEMDDKDVRQALEWKRIYDENKLSRKEREQRIELNKQREEMEQRIQEDRARHQMELERIEALSKIENVNALISISGPEQAAIIAQLEKTKALKYFSTEQILAMNAENNPKLAEGLAEIFRALSATGGFEQAERLIGEVKESGRLQREDYQHNLQMLAEMFNKALDSVRDTAVAFSGKKSLEG